MYSEIPGNVDSKTPGLDSKIHLEKFSFVLLKYYSCPLLSSSSGPPYMHPTSHPRGSTVLSLLVYSLLLISSLCSLALGVCIFITWVSDLFSWTLRSQKAQQGHSSFCFGGFGASVSLPFLYGIPFPLLTLSICYCMSICSIKTFSRVIILCFIKSWCDRSNTSDTSIQSCCMFSLFKLCLSLCKYCDFFHWKGDILYWIKRFLSICLYWIKGLLSICASAPTLWISQGHFWSLFLP